LSQRSDFELRGCGGIRVHWLPLGRSGLPNLSSYHQELIWRRCMRTRIAIWMAVVAALGVVAAHRAEVAEEETSTLERQLAQGQVLELTRRTEMLSWASQGIKFEDITKNFLSRGLYLQRNADALKLKTRDLDVKAEEEFAAARVYRRIAN